MRRFILTIAAILVTAHAGFADPIEGVWLTEPDAKAQVGHVEIRSCGGAFCGTLVRAYGSNGARVTTPNVGRQLVWDLRPVGGRRYGPGRIYVPLLGADFPVEMTLSNGWLRLRACNSLGVCRTQRWQKVN